MSPRLFILCICLGVVSLTALSWLGASAVMAAPPPVMDIRDETPDPIFNGYGDILRFFRANGFDAPFKYQTGMRDESLGRRYYRVRIGPERVDELRRRLVHGWTWGRFNRGVYENNISSRLPRSHNLPRWWKQGSAAGITIMLDHGGKPNWYFVINADGEVNLMWVGL